MKIAYKFFIVVTFSFLLFSCDKGDVFTGSPEDSNVEHVALTGTIATTETSVVAGQRIPITVTIPQTFPVDVNVQATSFIVNTNKRFTRTILIPAGETSVLSYVNAPGGDSTDLPFIMSVQLSLTAITTVQSVDVPVGFEGKQYTLTSNVLELEYGDTSIPSTNAKRLGIRFDFKGPYTGQGPNYNDLNIVLKKNGNILAANTLAVASSLTAPLAGSLTSTARYEQLYLLDIAQKLKIFNKTPADSTAGIYSVKATTNVALNYKVGDEVSIANFNGTGSVSLVVPVATVPDAFTFTFNYAGAHLFAPNTSFAQPVFVDQGQWSPFLAYTANSSTTYNGTVYYAKFNILTSLVGNLYPNNDPANWTNAKPIINWATAFPAAVNYAAGTAYSVNSVVKYNGAIYMSKVQITSATSNPATDTNKWVPAVTDFPIEVTNYTSTDTYEMSVYAKTLNGSTTSTTPVDLPYKIAVRYPNEDVKIYSGIATNLTVGTSEPQSQDYKSLRQQSLVYLALV